MPLLLGYIISSITFGNVFSGLVDHTFLETIADISVTLLLFTLGVEFSFHRLRRVLRIVGGAAAVQVVVSLVMFFGLFRLAGIEGAAALFLSSAAALSSTAVVIKILSEKAALDSIAGQVLTGWLVVQDLAVIPIMVLLPVIATVGIAGETSLISIGSSVVANIVKASVFIVLIVMLGRFGIPRVLSAMAKIGSREIFLLVTVGIVFLSVVVSFSVGLPAAIGAFIAGLLIAETSQNHAIFAEIRPLRDIFAVIFFVALGMVLPVSFLIEQAGILMLLLTAILATKLFINYGLVRFLGYHKKTAFIAGAGLLSMSEFGVIIAREGLNTGVLTSDQYVLGVSLTFLTIIVSAPILTQAETLYYRLSHTLGAKWPQIFGVKGHGTPSELEETERMKGHVVICGYGRVGKYVGRALQMAGVPFVVVEYNFTTVRDLKNNDIPVVYGDPADIDVLLHANMAQARSLVVAIADRHTQEMVIANAQTLNKAIQILCRSHFEEDHKRLKSLGASVIIQPEFEAAVSITHKLLQHYRVAPGVIEGKISRIKLEHGLG